MLGRTEGTVKVGTRIDKDKYNFQEASPFCALVVTAAAFNLGDPRRVLPMTG